MHHLTRLALDTLATYRVTKLVVSDEITSDLREKWMDHFGSPEDSKLAYLVTCPHCVSVWAAGALSFTRMMFPDSKLVDALSTALATSALTGIMAEREDSF